MEKIKLKPKIKPKKLQGVKPIKYTAMELHPMRPMMGRVQRREQRRRYHQEVMELYERRRKGDKVKYLEVPKTNQELSLGKKPKLRRTRLAQRRRRRRN